MNLFNIFKFGETSKKARHILNDDLHNHDIKENGFVTIDWLQQSDIDALQKLVNEINTHRDDKNVHIPTQFLLSAFNNSYEYKEELYNRIYDYLKDKVDVILNNYEPLVINVFEKHPGNPDDSVAIHQNPSFVEEPYFKSVSVWIPLQYVNKNNGTLGVLANSHDAFDKLRSGNMPDIFGDINTKLQDVYFEPLNLKAGQATVLDDSLIHWSYPNRSNGVRTAIQLIMVPKEAKHIYYYYNTSNTKPQMDLYEVDKSFFFRFNCKEEPIGLKYIKTVPYKYENLKESDLHKHIKSLKTPSTSNTYNE